LEIYQVQLPLHGTKIIYERDGRNGRQNLTRTTKKQVPSEGKKKEGKNRIQFNPVSNNSTSSAYTSHKASLLSLPLFRFQEIQAAQLSIHKLPPDPLEIWRDKKKSEET
jgi:hypothetical protein